MSMSESLIGWWIYDPGWNLAMHLISKHADSMAIERSHKDNEAQHDHEHDGPGTIRNHPRDWLGWDEHEIEAVLEECEAMS